MLSIKLRSLWKRKEPKIPRPVYIILTEGSLAGSPCPVLWLGILKFTEVNLLAQDHPAAKKKKKITQQSSDINPR